MLKYIYEFFSKLIFFSVFKWKIEIDFVCNKFLYLESML